jgi:ATP-dependent DNA helicase RecG
VSSYSPLDRPAQFLKGVGPRRAEFLGRLGLLTARDVLYHVPRRYEDASTVQPIGTLQPGSQATVAGRVVSKGVLPTRKGLRIFQAVIRDRSGVIECSWPGQPFLDRVIARGDLLLVSGSVRFFHGRQLQPKEYVILAREGESVGGGGGAVFPIYPATEGLSQRQVRKLISDNLDDLVEASAAEEVLPAELLAETGVPALHDALRALHRPESLAQAEAGRRRLALEELFFLQLLHALVYHEQNVQRPGIAFPRMETLIRPFYRSLPFELTAAQRRVLGEIGADMTSTRRMNRLLQGDVGAGKTVIALFAMLRAVENGYQAALMAPTEILAEQHLRTVRALCGDLSVPLQLLTGRMGAAERRDALARIASGDAQLVIGTHALIQDRVEFHRLGLVVVDEQHRFGVRQRLALAERGEAPDVLVMSATPIPRSLALTLYGDLDLSILDERPPGRQAILTRARPASARAAVFDFVREQVREGRQAYLVYPLVEESEALALKSAGEEYRRLGEEVFPDLRLALLHGQMPSEEKDQVMVAFARGEIDVLVATSVIEVGIDVPNATLMVIEHPERFGLSQLHQLRGRVGRGSSQSYCILLTGSREGADRLRVFTDTEDGFRIAEADLRLRGQGDLFGERQSGLPAFRFADLEKDLDLLTAARAAARNMVEADPKLVGHTALAEALRKRYGERLRMFQAG